MRIGLLKRLIAGLTNLETEVSAVRGQFSLFALIEDEHWPEDEELSYRWCLYVAAPWVWEEGYGAVKYLQERVRPYQEGWNPFERSLTIQTVKPTSPHLEEVWEYCSTEKGMVEIYDVEILDISARRGYIFASRRPENFDAIRSEALLEYERRRQRQDQDREEQLADLKAGLRGPGRP